MSGVNLVDTSGWIEYLTDTKNADNFAKAIEDTNWLIIPSIVLFEVYKKLSQHWEEEEVLQTISSMQRAQIVPIDAELAITAASLQQKHNLPMADSMILAAARYFNATLWTQDSDFKRLENVKYFPKN